MIIAGMNKYFSKHGRIIGLVIVVIISVTFVLFFGGMSVFDNFGRGSSKVVSLVGRKVDVKVRQEEVKRIYLWISLHNPGIDLSKPNIPLNSATVEGNLLRSYAAEDMGIIVGDKAVDNYIKTVPMFQTAGLFDSKKYQTYLKDTLKPVHYTQKDLKEAVREMLQHEALKKTVTDSVIVPEEEVREGYINLFTKIEAQLLDFKTDDFSKGIVLKDDELQIYYDTHKDKYKTAPAARGKLVVFSYDACSKEAAGMISDKDVLKYYEDNKFLYKKIEDPDKKKLKKDLKPPKPEYESFEDVKDKIRKELAENKTKSVALEKAQKFSDNAAVLITDVFYDIPDKIKAQLKCTEIFEKEAAKVQLNVKDSGWLYQGTYDVKGIGEEPSVVDTMVRLFNDNPVSEPIKGKKGVFVALLEAKEGPKAQSFEKVKDMVKKDLTTKKALMLAREAARNTAVDISERLTKGEKLEDIQKQLKIKFEKLTPISALSPVYRTNGGTIQKLAFKTPEGKISKVETTREGALMVYVTKKLIPTKEEFDKQKRFFTMQYTMTKQDRAYDNFLSALLKASTDSQEKK